MAKWNRFIDAFDLYTLFIFGFRREWVYILKVFPHFFLMFWRHKEIPVFDWYEMKYIWCSLKWVGSFSTWYIVYHKQQQHQQCDVSGKSLYLAALKSIRFDMNMIANPFRKYVNVRNNICAVWKKKEICWWWL